MPIAKVALDVPLNDVFDYQLPDGIASPVGRRVLVSFGFRRRMCGIVTEVTEHSSLPPGRIKAVERIYDDMPPLPADLLALFRFCAQYYHHPLGEVILNALPQLWRQPKAAQSFLPTAYTLTPRGRSELAASVKKSQKVKLQLLAAFEARDVLSEEAVRAISTRSPAILHEWHEAGFVRACDPVPAAGKTGDTPPVLNTDQAEAVTEITSAAGAFSAWLLYGTTGSGKTEVYLHAIAEQLAAGRQVLVLVPEINLTPQLEGRFRRRFPDRRIVSLHSHLAPAERVKGWLSAYKGEADIVLGTRLSVFTPLPRIGLIVVDEEHDGSFKQQDGLRYSARDVAVFRAKQANIPIVLGSATPALETFCHALEGRYRLLRLRERAVATAALPAVETIDTRPLRLIEGLSEPAIGALQDNLLRGEQSMIFLNRRGYAPVLLCSQCGWVSTCTRCAARLVLHLNERQIRCHHCGLASPVPRACPDCGDLDLAPVGHGTQRLEDALNLLLPTARVLRVDRDSTRRKDAIATMIDAVHRREIDVLVGTQMLAKGHDFPNLTLVVVINADSGLYSADFRASERLFSQLMQVAGRAGRADLPGRVLIQTQVPEHPVFAALKRHDYGGFAQELLKEREQVGFPPYCHQAILRAEAEVLDEALAFLTAAARQGLDLPFPVTLYDPVPALMYRLAGRERAQLLVQATERRELHAFLHHWLFSLRAQPAGKVHWTIDVDPADF